MIDKEYHIKQTEQAWNRLYRRLEENNDLAGIRPDRIHTGPVRIRNIAAVITGIVILSLTISYFMTIRSYTKEHDLLTSRNTESSTTLVTTLEDGSIVYIASETSLYYPKHFPTDSRTVQLEGTAMFDVAGNRSCPFIIETENSRIEVVGTAFNLKSRDNIPYELSVQRGAVKVALKKNGKETYVHAGETLTWQSGEMQISPTSDNRQFTRYTEKIRFKDETLGNILRVINKQSALKTITADPALEKRILTVAFSNCEPQVVANLLCAALSLHAHTEGNTILLSGQSDN